MIQTSPDLTEVYNRKVGPDGGVPAKVIQIAWNNNLILAKQQELQNRRLFPGDRFKVPAPGKFEWWIIDARIGTRYGPMDEAEFLTKVKALGEETLKLQNVSDVKGKEFAQ